MRFGYVILYVIYIFIKMFYKIFIGIIFLFFYIIGGERVKRRWVVINIIGFIFYVN